MMVIKQLAQMAVGWDRKTERERYLFSYRVASVLAQAISLLPLPISLLFQMFRSDKHALGWHSYGATYGRLFRYWKCRRVKILEIGIGGYRDSLGGRSLLAWQAFSLLA